MFDLSKEDRNPINPIYGKSLLLWLREHLKKQLPMSEPEPEDWGWYTDIEWQGRGYMVGAVGLVSEDGEHEWILQFEKHRTFLESLLGKERMTEHDPCLLFFKRVLEEEPELKNVKIE